jgi:hypothetical protein
MKRLFVLLTILIFSASPAPAAPVAQEELKDLYFGEALYYAFQGEWFDAIASLDTELMLHHGVDEPERDTLHYHINQVEFDVGDFELAYRMHQRAGRAITAVIEGNVEEPVRNEAIFRLARIYFQKDQPLNAWYAVERISGMPWSVSAEQFRRRFAMILIFCGLRSSWPTAVMPKPKIFSDDSRMRKASQASLRITLALH